MQIGIALASIAALTRRREMWWLGSVFGVLGAVIELVAVLLGLEANAPAGVLRLDPALPEWLPEVRLQRLRVGEASVDLRVSHQPGGGHELDVERTEGKLEVILA